MSEILENQAPPQFCPDCGLSQAFLPFSNKTLEVRLGAQVVQVEGLSGSRCEACGEISFDHDSAVRYANAGDALVLSSRPPA